MIYNDLQWATMTERVIPVMSQNEDFRKRQKKKDQGTCVRKCNVFSLLHDSPFNDDSISNYYAWR